MRDDSHQHGLPHDLKVLRRRQLLRLTAGVGVMTIFACSDDGAAIDDTGTDTDNTTDNTTTDTPTGGGSCTTIPAETAGPYPGNGSNGANALALSGIVRSDIRTSVADASGTADGVPLTVTLTIVDASCSPLANHAVYIWQCDRAADYSMYTGSAVSENYLRGVQETDADGKVTFVSIFPACYSGRWPHIHFEVYPSLAATDSAGNKLATSQLALPGAACEAVYATAGYEPSIPALAKLTLATDSVFKDGFDQQLADISGSVDAGYTATLTVTV